ncbi:MAG: ABC-type Fe3+ transport system, permease component [Rhizobium sp.]|nr:ABC-type Fe3+ transport system, permease component [Rhizobium sp.]
MDLPAGHVSAPLLKRQQHPLLQGAAVLFSLVIVVPLVAIVWIALTGGTADLVHVVTNILPRALARTAALLVLISVATAVTGILAAWLTVSFEFPLRRLLTVALVLPLAMPTYLAAYAAGEFFDFTGPLQSAVRAIFGFSRPSEYWFPDIRSLGGAVLVMGSVLYPYVYLACRSMFLLQGRSAADVARTLGASPVRVFFRVQLPMARPAIAAGLMLVMMETLNDIGAVEFLGVNTLTFAIYDAWLNRGSLSGAAQIAVVMLVFVVLMILAERHARRSQRFAGGKTTTTVHDAARVRLRGVRKWFAMLFCILPVAAGFLIPAFVLGGYAIKRLDVLFTTRVLSALWNTVLVGCATAAIAVTLAFILAYSARVGRNRFTALAARSAAFGYAVPGTVLAIGVLIPLASLDNTISALARQAFGIQPGLIMSGTMFAIVYALAARFLTMAEGTVEAGFHKLPMSLDHASRTLGRTGGQTLRAILIPAMRPAVLTAALLVFIETIKELSATILLRPFNFNTLATLVYEDASRSQVPDAAVPALIIIVAGLVPVIMVSRSLDRGR